MRWSILLSHLHAIVDLGCIPHNSIHFVVALHALAVPKDNTGLNVQNQVKEDALHVLHVFQAFTNLMFVQGLLIQNVKYVNRVRMAGSESFVVLR